MPKYSKIGAELQERGLKDVVFTAMMGVSDSQKQKLPDRLKKHFKTANVARRFVTKSTFEDKRELLQYLELKTFLVVCPEGIGGVNKFLDVYGKFKERNVSDGLYHAAKNMVYVTDDKQFAYVLGNMAQSITSIPYEQHLELQRVGSIFKKWSRKLPHSEDENFDYYSQVIAKTILWSGMQFEKTEAAIGLSSHLLKVLYFFYSNRTKYAPVEDIIYYFNGFVSKTKVASAIKELLRLSMIQKTFDWRKKEYTITKVGIRTVHQFRDRVLKSFNF